MPEASSAAGTGSPSTELVRCAYSGIEREAVHMLRVGDMWLAPQHKDAAVQFLLEGGVLPFAKPASSRLPSTMTLLRRAGALLLRNWRVLVMVELCLVLPFDLWIWYAHDQSNFGGGAMMEWMIYLASSWQAIFTSVVALRALSLSWASGRATESAQAFKLQGRWLVGTWLVCLPAEWTMSIAYDIPDYIRLIGAGVPAFAIVPAVVGLGIFFPISVWLTFPGTVMVDKDERLLAAVASSFRLVRGHFWRLAAYTAVWTIYLVMASVCSDLVYEALPETPDYWRIMAFVQLLLYALSTPLLVFFFVTYKAVMGDERQKI